MPELNRFEYGNVLRVNFNQNLTTATELGFTLEPKFGESIEKTNQTGVTIGTTNINVGDETYLANEYTEYTIEENQLENAGQYRMKGYAIFPIGKVITDFQQFTVLD